MNRREFLKTAYRVGGLAALYSLGAVRQAQAWGILPAVVGGDTGVLWADWDESEGTLNVDFAIFLKNTSAGGNDTGESIKGTFSGADLVGTQVGNLAGATDTPPRRAFDGVDDYMNWTQNGLETVMAGPTWTFIWKTSNCQDGGGYIADLEGATIILWRTAAGNIQFYYKDASNGVIWNDQGTTGSPGAAVGYTFMQSDGTNLRAGWSLTRPTTWASIPANQKLTTAVVPDAGGFAGRKNIFGNVGVHKPTLNGFYFVADSTALIV